jgi:hypothetical protein
MTAFERAWSLVKMAWKPDSFEGYGLWGDQQGPHSERLDAGLYKPHYAHNDPDWFHQHTYDKHGKKKNQWHRHHDQDWALNPHISQFIPPKEQRKKPIGERSAWRDRGGRWIQVDTMMKPLLEALWAKGIKTKFSDVGGDLRENPLYQHNEELEEKSVFGGRERPKDTHQGYLWFGDEGIPEQAKHFPRMSMSNQDPNDSPWIDDKKWNHERNPDGETIRWSASDDLSNLRQLYDAFEVPFPEEHMKDGGYQWR